MPETAALAAWNILHLGGNAFDTAAVEFIPGCIVQGVQQNAGLDIVKVSALVLFNFSAFVKNGVDPACGIVQVLLFFAIKSSDELKKGKKITSQVLIHLRG